MNVSPTPNEVGRPLPGDELLPRAQIAFDRAATLDAPPEEVWPWLLQLGKGRAGWYLPRSVERFIPPRNRAIRHLDDRWLKPFIGESVPDYGPGNPTLELASIDPPRHLAFTSERGKSRFVWAMVLEPVGASQTRLQLRLRIYKSEGKLSFLVGSVGDLFDKLTILGMAAGLQERLSEAAEI